MVMAESDLAQVAKLITDSESRIVKNVDEKVTALEKNMIAQINPLIKEQDKHAVEIDRIADRYFQMDNKIVQTESKIREQGGRFGQRIDEIEKMQSNHEKDHIKMDERKSKMKYIVIGSIASIIVSVLLIYIGKAIG